MKFKKQGILFPFLLLLFLGLPFRGPYNLFCLDDGFKYIDNYSRKDYRKTSPQNWWILQDKRGVIFVANHSGLLEYDGVSWRHIDVPNKNVRSMALDKKGTLFIGGNNEFGYVEPDETGSLQYISLSAKLKNHQKNFSTIWKTYSTKDGIYFQAKEILFRWDYKHIKKWLTDKKHRFHFSYVCEGDFFIKQDQIGIKKMVNDKPELIPGGELFADKRIYMMVPYDKGKLLIGTREHGLYIYNGVKAVPFPTEADAYIKENALYHGIRLSSPPAESGWFALATGKGGLVIIDSQGRLKKIFTKAHGLRDKDIKYIYEDSERNLWLGLNRGISRLEYASPISFYDERTDITGLVLSVAKHGNTLYAGTSDGLFQHVPSASLMSPGKFQPVPGIGFNCASLLSTGDSFLAAASNGVFQIKKNHSLQQIINKNTYFLLRSRTNQNRIWAGIYLGLVSLYRDSEKSLWKREHTFKNITQDIKTIVEDKNGDLWLGTSAKGVINVDFQSAGTIQNFHVNQYGTANGLPSGEVNTFWAAEHVIVATVDGIFRFDETSRSFIPDSTLGREFSGRRDARGVFRITEDGKKNIWFHSQSKNFQAVPRSGSYVIRSKPLFRIPPDQSNTIYPDPDEGVIWFANHDGLIRFDPTIKKDDNLHFSALIRTVWTNEKVLYEGLIDLFPVISYRGRNLRFEFAAPFFEGNSEIYYQYLLEGYDDEWSYLSTETRRNYTNLDSGVYRFRVRVRNIYGDSGSEAVFNFRILPPWYKTWWAFSFYALLFFLLVYFIVKWRSGKLEREKQRLEQVVKERTKEIIGKNQQLEEQSEKLQEMDTVKSRFFANISHEFRTPLTLIMGPIEQMLSDSGEKTQKERLSLVLRNSHRLLTLINQLLDLSRFDSGKMKLQAAKQNIIPFLKGILASFELVASGKQIRLLFSAEEDDITLYFDAEKLEEVIGNLLSNALKFTPAKGEIIVTVKRIPPDFLDISVRDTGIGISKEQLAHIFDRFYQAKGFSNDPKNHDVKGTGIGLALARELVTLHQGKIDVHSSEGKGTEFIIRLPMGKDHLKPDEITDISETETQHKKTGEISVPTVTEEAIEKDTAVEEDENGSTGPGEEEKNVILVVEDNADVRKYIRGSLEPLYIVKEAEDGREGIERAVEIIPDLIISDVMMPEVDGCELCKTLKTDIKTSHIPIILLTAKASEENIIEGLETGADDYITKPFNTAILCARIKNLIDLRRGIQQKIQRNMMLQPAEIQVSSMDETFIKEVQSAIEKNLSESEFNVEQLGKKLYMSRATLYRKILALTGESPRDFIRSYRLKRGAQLLKANFGNVTEVAFEVGFSSTAYFTRCFKKKFHQLPHAFQASQSS